MTRRIDISGWKELRLGDIFDIRRTNGIFNANSVCLSDTRGDGYYPYVVRTSYNNGVKGYLRADEACLNPAGTLSFGCDTSQIFYRSEPYFTGDKINVLTLKGYELNESLALYLTTVIRIIISSIRWGESYSAEVISELRLPLPVTSRDVPDWEYMSSYMAGVTADAERSLSILSETVSARDIRRHP